MLFCKFSFTKCSHLGKSCLTVPAFVLWCKYSFAEDKDVMFYNPKAITISYQKQGRRISLVLVYTDLIYSIVIQVNFSA